MQSHNLVKVNSPLVGNWEQIDENDDMRMEFKSDGTGLWVSKGPHVEFSDAIESYEVNDHQFIISIHWLGLLSFNYELSENGNLLFLKGPLFYATLIKTNMT
jgi:hypothetical protein